MNANMMLEPGQSILVMANGARGKIIRGTRVFTNMHDFKEWFMENRTYDQRTMYAPGDVICSYHVRKYVCKTPGFQLNSDSIFLASQTENPKKLKVTGAMLGIPEFEESGNNGRRHPKRT
ncbi:hypothetical protein [Xanthomonas phage JGB6]|nr:hypothetical protein [Xanthomonas phage JGB6]